MLFYHPTIIKPKARWWWRYDTMLVGSRSEVIEGALLSGLVRFCWPISEPSLVGSGRWKPRTFHFSHSAFASRRCHRQNSIQMSDHDDDAEQQPDNAKCPGRPAGGATWIVAVTALNNAAIIDDIAQWDLVVTSWRETRVSQPPSVHHSPWGVHGQSCDRDYKLVCSSSAHKSMPTT
jgi:hypothetical protein